MKKILKVILFVIFSCSLIIAIVSCTEKYSESSFNEKASDDKVSSISVYFKRLKAEENIATGIVSNEMSEFDFEEEIDIVGANFVVASDIHGEQVFLSKKVELAIGDNIFYVLIQDEEKTNVIVVTIRRRPIYTVKFNVGEEKSVYIQEVEEGCLAEEPNKVEKKGYVFEGWDYDFSYPICDNLIIEAKFSIAKEMVPFLFTSTEQGCVITGVKDSSIDSVFIPNYVIAIQDKVFENCYKLVEVINDSMHFTVGKNSVENGWVGYYALVVFNPGDLYMNKFKVDNGYKVYNDGEHKILVGYYGDEKDLEIPNYITHINQYAFYKSSIETIRIMNDEVILQDFAFFYCLSLESIVVNSSSIQYASFAFCVFTTSVTIGDEVINIGENSFSYLKRLQSIVIGKEVETIGDGAFSECEKLQTVFYKGTKKDWDNILIGDYNEKLISAKRYYYIEKEQDVPMGEGNYWHYDEYGNPIAW